MSLTVQWIAVVTVVAAAVWAALRALWRVHRRARHGRVECSGCPLAASCQKRKAAGSARATNMRQCPRPKAKSGN